MGTIQFKEANCKNCYKCIRGCPVKAINFKNYQAEIIEDECILCGRCLQLCPQNAKSVIDDVGKVRDFINKGFKVYGSIAPTFAPAFNIKSEAGIHQIFQKLGFTHVEETAVGATQVSSEYSKLLINQNMTNIISTACPAIVSLVEKYYPELIEQLAPVVSPMIAHAKMMKETYGSSIKIIFVGPCLAKKEEYHDLQNDGIIDAVITFEELENWISEENLICDNLEENMEYDEHLLTSRFYPAPGGILKTLEPLSQFNYKFIKFDGIERCMGILNQIKNGNFKGYFIEMNSCVGGCLGGTCMNSDSGCYLSLKEKLTEFINKPKLGIIEPVEYKQLNFTKKFIDKSKKYKIPDEQTMVKILAEIGKFSKDKELNCGACGYPTCRDKAIAVYNNKAEVHMCLPFMRERAESMSNVTLNSSPNAVFAVNIDLIIQEINSAARKLFNLETQGLEGRSIFDVLDCADIVIVSETKVDSLNKKFEYKKYGLIVEQSIIYIKEAHMIIIVIKDITENEKRKQQMYKVRNETIKIAQNVINNQMVVAQEIASLLGETTAETKIALTKLKNSIQIEMSEDK